MTRVFITGSGVFTPSLSITRKYPPLCIAQFSEICMMRCMALPSVLIIDDNEARASIIKTGLAEAGYGDVAIVYDDLEEIAREDNEGMIHVLDILFTHGQMSDQTRGVIRRAIAKLPGNRLAKVRAQLALYLTMISPDYTIIK